MDSNKNGKIEFQEFLEKMAERNERQDLSEDLRSVSLLIRKVSSDVVIKRPYECCAIVFRSRTDVMEVMEINDLTCNITRNSDQVRSQKT